MSSVVCLYRSILKHTKRAGRPLQPAKDIFAQHKSETDPKKEYVKEAEEHLAFLKIITPRVNLSSNNESGVFVFKDGKVVSGRADRVQKLSVRDNRIDPEDLKRHERLVRYDTSLICSHGQAPILYGPRVKIRRAKQNKFCHDVRIFKPELLQQQWK